MHLHDLHAHSLAGRKNMQNFHQTMHILNTVNRGDFERRGDFEQFGAPLNTFLQRSCRNGKY